MVLSNKKLKQKFRSLLAESLASSDSGKPHGDAAGGDANRQLEGIKELLRSKSKKPRTNKAKRRTKKSPSSAGSKSVGENEETQMENGENGEPSRLREKKKSKKRKMEPDGDDGSTENEQKKNEQKEKKDKKKEKKKKKKGKEEKGKEQDKNDEKGNESVNGGNDEVGVAESINNEESEQNAKKVYVGGIPYYSTEDDIRSFFEGCGTVTEVDCMTFPESGKFRGIAFLTFKTEAAAKRALALDGADMGGFYLKIQPYKANKTNGTQKSDFSPEIVDGYYRIYVGNLSWDITEDDLRTLFCDCKVSSIRWGMDKETGDFKGYAHVDFADSVSLAVALKLDQNVVCGRPARIRCAVPRKEEEAKKSFKPSSKRAEVGRTEENAKNKRRTCYECGLAGHISSSCPQKRAVEADDSGAKSEEDAKKSFKPSDKKAEPSGMEAEVGKTEGNAKKKRRTCYECGVPGHISSSCPQKRAVEADESGAKS